MAKIIRIELIFLFFCVAGSCCAATSELFVDPMQPIRYQATSVRQATTKDVTTKDWTLTAVLISAGRSVAVVNGKSLQKGEILDGYKLVEITPDKVLMRNGKRKLVLRRAGTGLKKISPSKDIGKGSKP